MGLHLDANRVCSIDCNEILRFTTSLSACIKSSIHSIWDRRLPQASNASIFICSPFDTLILLSSLYISEGLCLILRGISQLTYFSLRSLLLSWHQPLSLQLESRFLGLHLPNLLLLETIHLWHSRLVEMCGYLTVGKKRSTNSRKVQ